LDLQSRIHFHEPERISPEAARAVRDELDRAGADVADRPGGFDRCATYGGSDFRSYAGRGRLLDHFLVAALQRAVALEEMDHVAAAIGDPWVSAVRRGGVVLLAQHAAVAECRWRLGFGGLGPRLECRIITAAPHAPAAAARHCLDQHRVADL